MNVKGISLVELIVAMVIVGTIYIGIFTSLNSETRTGDQLQLSTIIQDEIKAITSIMVRDIRLAGSFPNGKDTGCSINCEDIVVAISNKIEITRDLNGDGCCDDSEEYITYEYDGSKVCRKSSYTSNCEPFIGGITIGDLGVEVDSFQLNYFNKQGNTTSIIDQISFVEITGMLKVSQIAKTGADIQYPFKLKVSIRNRNL